MFENPINKLRFWCHKVIPLVYDEALSYYEVVCKVAKKINEVITDVNSLHETVVFQVNGKEPTDGNVQLGAEDFSGAFVGSINGITPEDDGSITIDAKDVGALPNSYTPPVTSVNNKTGNVSLDASDVSALPDSIDPVESVNGISPDAQGNVNVGTVKSVNNTMPDASGNVNLPTVAGVTSVDGVGADAQGNVQINAVKSVNGETPDSNGNVTLDATDVGAMPSSYTAPVMSVNSKTGAVTLDANDVGALPSSVVPVLKVNNTTPDANGNVNVGTVTKVNNISPNNGNVALTASDVNAMSKTRTAGTLEAVSGNTTISGPNFWRRCGDVAFFSVQITCTKSGGLSGDNALLTGFPVPQGLGADGMGLTEDLNVFKFHINETGGCTMSHQGNINNGKFALLTGCYTTNS